MCTSFDVVPVQCLTKNLTDVFDVQNKASINVTQVDINKNATVAQKLGKQIGVTFKSDGSAHFRGKIVIVLLFIVMLCNIGCIAYCIRKHRSRNQRHVQKSVDNAVKDYFKVSQTEDSERTQK